MSDRFHTNGGYFSPPGYLKVETGGSHDENPNGGVQIGVDEQGIPNMLEEGEPVYDDYVFSDNIYADADILKKFNIPEKYSGKLYSEIADSYVSEAEERPLDPISNNGLKAMLLRLADAQEAQKQETNKKELETELNKLSPEELTELNDLLSQQSGAVQPIETDSLNLEQAPVLMSEQISQYPVMANGGLLHKFENGGTTEEDIDSYVNQEPYFTVRDNTMTPLALSTGLRIPVMTEAEQASMMEQRERDNAIMSMIPFVGISSLADDAIESIQDGDVFGAGLAMAGILPVGKFGTLGRGASYLGKGARPTIARGLKRGTETFKDAVISGKRNIIASANKAIKGRKDMFQKAKEAKAVAKSTVDAAVQADANAAIRLAEIEASLIENPNNVVLKKVAESAAKKSRKANSEALKAIRKKAATDVKATIQQAKALSVGNANIGKWAARLLVPAIDIPIETWKASSRFGTGLLPTVKRIGATSAAFAGGAAAQYGIGEGIDAIKDNIQARTGNNSVEAYEKARATDPFVNRKAIGGLIKKFAAGGITGTDEEERPVYNGGEIDAAVVSANRGAIVPNITIPITGPLFNSTNGYRPRRTTQLFSLNPALTTPVRDNITTFKHKLRTGQIPSSREIQFSPDENLFPGRVISKSSSIERNPVTKPKSTSLPTWPRYAGAVMSGLTGLYNLFQKPDNYSLPTYTPVLPTGRIDFTDPVFNPIDQNMSVNDVLASGAGTVRGLRNSGLGPSTAAAIIAADNNIGRNIGTARTQIVDVNNQRRNDVINQRNTNAQALGQFQFGVDSTRSQILNQALLQNIQNNLLRQRLNYASEGEKYAAIQSNLDSLAKSLAGIGNENFSMNQIRDAYDYSVLPDGRVVYTPKSLLQEEDENKKNGGLLKRPKKK